MAPARPRLTISYECTGAWKQPPRRGRHAGKFGEPGSYFRPVRCALDDGATVLANPVLLPFAGDQFAEITCEGVIDLVRDEVGTTAEFGRLLSPGGRLRLTVPAAGPLAFLDAHNLQRYFSDTTHRGSRPPETAEIGWRRHYSLGDLQSLLAETGLRIVSVQRRGFSIAETVQIVAMLLFRWLSRHESCYERIALIANRVARIERRISSPLGAVFVVDARRLPDAPPGDGS